MAKTLTSRVDKLLSSMGYGSRREVAQLAMAGGITLDAAELTDVTKRIPVTADLPSRIKIDGEALDPIAGMVILLNKPLGMTCSHKEIGKLINDRADAKGTELSADEIEKLVAILTDPKRFNVPEWLLNRRKDKFDGKSSQCVSNQIATKLRDDLEHLKKVRVHRGLRHYWGVKVRGQHTGTTGRGRIAAQLAAERAK